MFRYDFSIGTWGPQTEKGGGVSNTKKALNISYDNFIFPVKLFLNDKKRDIPDIEEEHTWNRRGTYLK